MKKTKTAADVLAAIEERGGPAAMIADLVARGRVDPVTAYVMQRLFEQGMFKKKFDSVKALRALVENVGEFEAIVAEAQGGPLTEGALAERMKAFFELTIVAAVTDEEISSEQLQESYASYAELTQSGMLDRQVPAEILGLPAKEIAAASEAVYRLAKYNPSPNDPSAQAERNLVIQKAMQMHGIALGKQHGPKTGLKKRYGKNDQAKEYVLDQWENNAGDYESKAEFARVMHGRIKKFDVVVSANRISEAWLDGKKHPGKKTPS